MIGTLIANGDAAGIAAYIKENGLELVNGRIVAKIESTITWAKEQAKFYDARQQARKILLNSLYGALLNEALRFSDERMGQSVTLTGRSIARHMNAKINEIFTGEYDHTGKAIVYADTDSSYFSAAPLLDADTNANAEVILELYQRTGDAVNETFPIFMDQTFHTGLERGSVIAAGLELLAKRALFIKKKKYACLKAWDDDDKWKAQDKLKVMGLDLKRADTPEYMQDFLKTILMDVLNGAEEEDILKQVRDFRTLFKNKPAWDKGSPKKVSNLSAYGAKRKRSQEIEVFTASGLGDQKKVMIPEHVLASLEWNNLMDRNGDKHSMRITDGSRIVVCKLKNNNMRIRAVAYPVDEPHLPDWFKELPFNHDLMEQTIIDKKITNLLEVLDWDLKHTHHNDADELIVF